MSLLIYSTLPSRPPRLAAFAFVFFTFKSQISNLRFLLARLHAFWLKGNFE